MTGIESHGCPDLGNLDSSCNSVRSGCCSGTDFWVARFIVRGEDDLTRRKQRRRDRREGCREPSRRRRPSAGARRVTRSRKQAAPDAPAVCFRDRVTLLLARRASRRNGARSRFFPCLLRALGALCANLVVTSEGRRPHADHSRFPRHLVNHLTKSYQRLVHDVSGRERYAVIIRSSDRGGRGGSMPDYTRRQFGQIMAASTLAAPRRREGGQTSGNVAGSLTDVPGIKVGHYTDARRPTGCTAILFDTAASAGVDYNSSAPGESQEVLLQPVSPV